MQSWVCTMCQLLRLRLNLLMYLLGRGLLAWYEHLRSMRRYMIFTVAWLSTVLLSNCSLFLPRLTLASFGVLTLLQLVHGILNLTKCYPTYTCQIYIRIWWLISYLCCLLFTCLVCCGMCLWLRLLQKMSMISVLNRTTLSSIIKCISTSMCSNCDSLLSLFRQYWLIEDHLLTTQ